MLINFKNVTHPGIKKAFELAIENYTELKDFEITLSQKRIKSSTMQAQPIFNFKSLFGGVKSYKINLAIYVRDSKQLRVDELPQKVLVGWFAHELGHIADYTSRSNAEMIYYGLKYYFSNDFKKEVEHRADVIAINNGYLDEIIATKEFLLGNKMIAQTYKDKLIEYYMSVEDVKLCAEDILLTPNVSE